MSPNDEKADDHESDERDSQEEEGKEQSNSKNEDESDENNNAQENNEFFPFSAGVDFSDLNIGFDIDKLTADLTKIGDALGTIGPEDIADQVTPELRQTIIESIATPEMLSAAQQPVIEPEVLSTLSKPILDPEMLEALQQPAIDPEVLKSLQQPTIDPEILDSLQQPAIDPELIEVLQSFEEPELIHVYETAAAFEQIEHREDASKDEIGPEAGQAIQEDAEPPEIGGFLSTFFNVSALMFLRGEISVSDESREHLLELLQSSSVENKTESFKHFIQSLRGSAAAVLLYVVKNSIFVAWTVHSEEENNNSDREEDQQTDSTNNGDNDELPDDDDV